MQERSLIRRLKQHQPQALEELITTYSPYVGTIIRNIIGKYLAEPDVEELTADVFLAVWEHTDQLKAVEGSIDQKILGELLQDVLDTLSAKDREILVRYYYCYEPVRQIADTLHMSESAVKMRMSRARKKLQQELVEWGYAYEDTPAVQQVRFTAMGKGAIS